MIVLQLTILLIVVFVLAFWVYGSYYFGPWTCSACWCMVSGGNKAKHEKVCWPSPGQEVN